MITACYERGCINRLRIGKDGPIPGGCGTAVRSGQNSIVRQLTTLMSYIKTQLKIAVIQEILRKATPAHH